MTEWRNASEPPSGLGNVLVTDGRDVGLGYFLPKRGVWQSPTLSYVYWWMPLPQPPKQEPSE